MPVPMVPKPTKKQQAERRKSVYMDGFVDGFLVGGAVSGFAVSGIYAMLTYLMS